MLIPHARARRTVAAVILVATLAGCGTSPSGNPIWTEAQSPQAVSTTAVPASPLSSSTSPAAAPSASPSKSATSKSPKPPPPGGVSYADRLPKFDRPPKAEKVNLPEGTSAAYFSRIPTEQPVAFLTIDDGWVKRPEALDLFRQSGVRVTLFLTINSIRSDPPFFKRLQDAGAVIEAHTLTHPELKGKPYDFQRHEICGSADQLATWYGRRPVLFRPPFGDKDDTTLKAAHDCGMTAGFFWKETVDKGIVRYQSGNTVQRGDIILMHFRDRFVDDFIAALQAIKAAGLTPALLEDYIPA